MIYSTALWNRWFIRYIARVLFFVLLTLDSLAIALLFLRFPSLQGKRIHSFIAMTSLKQWLSIYDRIRVPKKYFWPPDICRTNAAVLHMNQIFLYYLWHTGRKSARKQLTSRSLKPKSRVCGFLMKGLPPFIASRKLHLRFFDSLKICIQVYDTNWMPSWLSGNPSFDVKII